VKLTQFVSSTNEDTRMHFVSFGPSRYILSAESVMVTRCTLVGASDTVKDTDM